MKRLTSRRKGRRDKIRYRMHTSIQAAAYLADDPGREVIDRELEQVMKAGRGKTPHPHGSWFLVWCQLAAVGFLGVAAIGIVVLASVLAGDHHSPVAAGVVWGALIGVLTAAGSLARVARSLGVLHGGRESAAMRLLGVLLRMRSRERQPS